MRTDTDLAKLEVFMTELGQNVKGLGRVYLVGGSCALIYKWRASTIDIDLKAHPEPKGFFEAIAKLKESLDINVELAAPDQFIPQVPGWEERSVFVARHGQVDFYLYDFYSQALAKLERNHDRDQIDVAGMLESKLITRERLWELFEKIEPLVIRYPAISPEKFRQSVQTFCSPP